MVEYGAIFISDYLGIKSNSLKNLGVFDAIINKDSQFYLNIIKLRDSSVPEFKCSYNKINDFFGKIMKLLMSSTGKNDKAYKTALKMFNFHGIKEVNLGFSNSGKDAGFGPELSKKIISDAKEIIDVGINNPELFELMCLFEENIGPDRLSDMIVGIIKEDIREYTRGINKKLKLKETKKLIMKNGIFINSYKNCELWYLPEELLYKLPIATSWDKIDEVINANAAIRQEINTEVANKWKAMSSEERKKEIRESIFCDKQKGERIIKSYKNTTVEDYNVGTNTEYLAQKILKELKENDVFNYLEHTNKNELSSFEVAKNILNKFKGYVENNGIWRHILDHPSRKREKLVQSLIYLCGHEITIVENIDISCEPNEGSGEVDFKYSRGNDKTVVEIKISTNRNYVDGYKEQIEQYALSEYTGNKIYVLVVIDNMEKIKPIKELYEEGIKKNKNVPYPIFINATEKLSASKLH